MFTGERDMIVLKTVIFRIFHSLIIRNDMRLKAARLSVWARSLNHGSESMKAMVTGSRRRLANVMPRIKGHGLDKTSLIPIENDLLAGCQTTCAFWLRRVIISNLRPVLRGQHAVLRFWNKVSSWEDQLMLTSLIVPNGPPDSANVCGLE